MTVGTWLRSQLVATAARMLHVRPLMRAPIWIYRAGAGALLGPRLLMLEHTGRTSGTRRYVVLEVIGHPTADSYLVASGFGQKAQWFRNIQVDPRTRVYGRGRRPKEATARVLTTQEGSHVLSDYARRHPQTWNHVKPVLERTLGQPINESNPTMPIVELRLN